MDNLGSISFRVDNRKRVIGVSEIAEVKFENRMWTLYLHDKTFYTFNASKLIGGFNHLTKMWSK